MLETIISGLAVTLVTGLTFTAYKHPSGYKKLYVPLVVTVALIWFVRLIYVVGFAAGFSAAIIGTYDRNKGQIILTPSRESESTWIIFAPLLVVGYLAFLHSLPSILDLADSKNKKDGTSQV